MRNRGVTCVKAGVPTMRPCARLSAGVADEWRGLSPDMSSHLHLKEEAEVKAAHHVKANRALSSCFAVIRPAATRMQLGRRLQQFKNGVKEMLLGRHHRETRAGGSRPLGGLLCALRIVGDRRRHRAPNRLQNAETLRVLAPTRAGR